MNVTVIQAIVRDGRVEASAPADWPEGTQVAIEPLRQDSIGMREEDWPTSADGIAAMLERWDKLEPLEMTAEEEADLDAWRQKMKEYSIANMNRSIEELSQ